MFEIHIEQLPRIGVALCDPGAARGIVRTGLLTEGGERHGTKKNGSDKLAHSSLESSALSQSSSTAGQSPQAHTIVREMRVNSPKVAVVLSASLDAPERWR